MIVQKEHLFVTEAKDLDLVLTSFLTLQEDVIQTLSTLTIRWASEVQEQDWGEGLCYLGRAQTNCRENVTSGCPSIALCKAKGNETSLWDVSATCTKLRSVGKENVQIGKLVFIHLYHAMPVEIPFLQVFPQTILQMYELFPDI